MSTQQPNLTKMVPLDCGDGIIQQMPIADAEKYLAAFAANSPKNNPASAIEAMRRKPQPTPQVALGNDMPSLDDILGQEDTLDNDYPMPAPRPH